jgi:hypothetical protein
MKKTKIKNYTVDLEKVKLILKEADIQGLIRIGAPDDEYDLTAFAIVNRINNEGCDCKEDAVFIIYCVFLEGFCITYCNGKVNQPKQIDTKCLGSMDQYRVIVDKIFKDTDIPSISKVFNG